MKWAKLLYCYIPLPKKEREIYLGRVRSLVEKYKPLIEDEMRVDLEGISVEEYRHLPKDFVEKTKREGFPNDLPVNKANLFVLQLIGELYRLCREDAIDMAHLDSKIYVPFGLTTKANIVFDEKDGEGKQLDGIVIHELSHRLWHVLGGGDPNGNEGRIYYEGFASYCAKERFCGFYSERDNIPDTFLDSSLYKKGRKKVKQLVEIFGEDIVLRIPSEWEYLDDQIKFHE